MANTSKVAELITYFRGVLSVEDWQELGDIIEKTGGKLAGAKSARRPAMDARMNSAEAEFHAMFPEAGAAPLNLGNPGATVRSGGMGMDALGGMTPAPKAPSWQQQPAPPAQDRQLTARPRANLGAAEAEFRAMFPHAPPVAHT